MKEFTCKILSRLGDWRWGMNRVVKWIFSAKLGNKIEQAGADLGQAQSELSLGLGED